MKAIVATDTTCDECKEESRRATVFLVFETTGGEHRVCEKCLAKALELVEDQQLVRVYDQAMAHRRKNDI